MDANTHITRRAAFASFGALVSTAAMTVPVAASMAPQMTAEERRDHHLAEFQKACAEINPNIESWTINLAAPDGAVLLFGQVRTGSYQGDGTYESGRENVLGQRGRWKVRLMRYRLDDERVFEVRCPGETMHLPEKRFNAFIGRKLSNGGAA